VRLFPPPPAEWLTRTIRRAPVTDARANTAKPARCARCGDVFVQRRSDHRFCSPECRKLGEWKPGDPPLPDLGSVERLFDESRDPAGPVLDSDWRPYEYQFEGWRPWAELDGVDSVARMRQLYLLPGSPSPLRRSRPA
jgi:hypothetical protein